MKYFKFKTYIPGYGAECLSVDFNYYSKGKTLQEAKSVLVKLVGCTKNFFDEPEYTNITNITKNEYDLAPADSKA